MATAIKIQDIAPDTKYWPVIISSVRPIYIGPEGHKPDDYDDKMEEAIRAALGPLPIREAIDLYKVMIEYQNGDRAFDDNSPEDEASFWTLGVTCYLVATGTPRSKSEARARAMFLAESANESGELATGLTHELLATAITNMGKDITVFSKRSLPERIGADADKVGQVFLPSNDPKFNPLRDIAARLRYLSDNYEALVSPGTSADSAVYDEQEALMVQAAHFHPYTPEDALMLLGAIEFGVRPLLDAAEGECEREKSTVNKFQLQMALTALRGIYRLADWLEISHAIERRSVAPDMLEHHLSPFVKERDVA